MWSEFEGIERIVHMGAESHDGAAISLQGHSIGRWEGDTLVVDTTHFAEHRVGNAMGVPCVTYEPAECDLENARRFIGD